ALSGALSILPNHGGQPVPPLSYMGDLSGGGLFCALGVVLALMEREKSGKGQVVDHAMLDGIANLSTPFYAVSKQNPGLLRLMLTVLGAKSPYYQCYETRDGKYLSVGPVEARFYDELLARLGICADTIPSRDDLKQWPEITERIRQAFKTKRRDEWVEIFEGSDACVEPVLDLQEAPAHPHNAARGVFITKDGVPTPAPAPRLTRTPGNIGEMEAFRGQGTRDVMAELGYTQEQINALLEKRIVE
ncbi:MAG: CoA transferase, partial [Desulfatitalea sp.]|nr:CoA transferase [Desulfatitalea sp.]